MKVTFYSYESPVEMMSFSRSHSPLDSWCPLSLVFPSWLWSDFSSNLTVIWFYCKCTTLSPTAVMLIQTHNLVSTEPEDQVITVTLRGLESRLFICFNSNGKLVTRVSITNSWFLLMTKKVYHFSWTYLFPQYVSTFERRHSFRDPRLGITMHLFENLREEEGP
jgi:hypothetical protein